MKENRETMTARSWQQIELTFITPPLPTPRQGRSIKYLDRNSQLKKRL